MSDILVVDDDEMLREVYELMLTTAGYTVRTAYDGRNALEQVAAELPDLILLDMVMPNLDGVGFLTQFKATVPAKPVKIIVFSNLSVSDKLTTALELGADRHLTKAHLTPGELFKNIEELLAQA